MVFDASLLRMVAALSLGALLAFAVPARAATEELTSRDSASAVTAKAGRLSLGGTCSWSVRGNRITLRAGAVVNTRSSRSGTLQIQVWATRTPYRGGTLRGFILGTYTMDSLRGGFRRVGINRTVRYRPPPRGRYYTTMTLNEFTTVGWLIRDSLNFPRRTAFARR